MDKSGKIVLVVGATGQQGGATAKHLKAAGWKVRALTRDPNKPAAKALADQAIEVAKGDLMDRASLDAALKGIYGVFSVQQFWEHGYEAEIQQGNNIADAAKAAGVQHVVFSSVASANRKTGLPHFESKWLIEQHVRSLGLPATVIRPVFFMDNFRISAAPRMIDGVLTISNPLKPPKKLQMIAVDDIGRMAALAFEDPQRYIGKDIDLAGDELTMEEVAEQFGRRFGTPVRYRELPIDQLRTLNAEGAKMYEWFIDKGYEVDIASVRKLLPDLKTFDDWLKTIEI